MKPKRLLAILVFSSLYLAATGAWLSWHRANCIPAGHDAAQHLTLTEQYNLALRQDFNTLRETLKQQPARYPPLPHLLAAGLTLIGGDHARACRLAQAFWALLLGAFLWLISRELAEKSWLALLPPAVLLANPVAWTALTAFNFEIPLLAAAVVWLTLLLAAERVGSRVGIGAAVLLVGLLALIKPQLIVLILGGGLVLAYTGEAEVRVRRRLFLLVYLAFFLGWMLFSRAKTAHEFSVDYLGYPGDHFGLWYYPRLVALDYRGLTLSLALLFVLYLRYRADDWRREDAAFLLFFLVPLVFYSLLQTKRPWYLLAGYQALPLWFLYAVRRLWDKRLVKAMGCAVVLAYLLPAVGNVALVASAARLDDPKMLRFAGVEPPFPPSESEETMVREINRVVKHAPRDSILVDLWATEIRAERFWTLLLLDNPCLAAMPHVTPGWQMHDYVDQLLHAGFLFTVSEEQPELAQLPYPDAEKEAMRPAWQAAAATARRRFERRRSWDLADGRRLSLYRARDRDQHLSPPAIPAICGGETGENSDPRTDKEAGLVAYQTGDYQGAKKRLLAAFTGGKRDFKALVALAKAATPADGRTLAERLWRCFLTEAISFRVKIETINALAEPPWIELMLPESFYAMHELLLECHSEDPMERYSLLLARQKYEQNRDDWAAALRTVRRIKETATPEQLDGVRLSEALILLRLERRDEARVILSDLVAAVAPAQPVFADAALQLAGLQFAAGEDDEAKKSLRAAVQGVYDQNNLANFVLETAQRRQAAGDAAAARDLLAWAEERVSGSPRGLLMIERGKQCLSAGEIRQARELFATAAQLVEDPVSREWLRQTIEAIDRREYGPNAAEAEGGEHDGNR